MQGAVKSAPAAQGEFLEDEVDLEEYAKRGEKPPRARRYHIRIDEGRFTLETAEPTGRQLLALVDKKPCSHFLTQVFVGRDDEIVDPDEKADLLAPGTERFTVVAKDMVTITVAVPSQVRDREIKTVEVRRGAVAVAEIKRLAGVPDGYLLTREVNDVPDAIPDNATLDIHGCEAFDTCVRKGGAS